MSHIKHRSYTPRPEVTLFDLSAVTPEDAVREALYRLVLAGRFGYDPANGRCMYLTPDGANCAVGLLLPKGYELDEELNTGSTASFLIETLYPVSAPLKSHGAMLNALQEVHDEVAKLWPDHEPPGSERLLELLKEQVDGLEGQVFVLIREFLGGFYDAQQAEPA